MDKQTGKVVAQDAERIGPNIYHCTWSSPALGEVNGQRLVFFCGGDGVVYAFEALPQDLPDEADPHLEARLAVRLRPQGAERKRPQLFQEQPGQPQQHHGCPRVLQ